MTYQELYKKSKQDLLNDKSICKDNRLLYKKFLDWEEDKLNKIRKLQGKLDEPCFNTLYYYIHKLRNVNKWFKNKPLKNITKTDILRVYNDLENGTIKNKSGVPFTDKESYYNRIFKSKLFKMINKNHLSEEVIEFSIPKDNEEIEYLLFDDFLKIIEVVIQPVQKLLMWLCFDFGENINTMLRLIKNDFERVINKDTGEIEYKLNYRREILKRSRQKRSDINNFKQTAELLEQILPSLNDNDKLFNFEYRQAVKFKDRAIKITNTKTIPSGKKIDWGHFRKGMTCYLLSQGWSSDEVNKRLGHKPSQLRNLDKYANYLALHNQKPKKKLNDNLLSNLEKEIEQLKSTNKLKDMRIKENEELLKNITKKLEKLDKIAELLDQ